MLLIEILPPYGIFILSWAYEKKPKKAEGEGVKGRAFAAENRGMLIAGISLLGLALLITLLLIPWGGGSDSGPVMPSDKPSAVVAGEDGIGSADANGGDAATSGGMPEGRLAEEEGIDGNGGSSGELGTAATGEDFSDASPTKRYVTETQRHQNFLAAVAAGQVRRMDFISTDYQPSSDPNSSYITFSLQTADGSRSTGLMVMKQESGMWRISAVKQLSGALAGGTNYLVPAGFEEVLAAELQEHQLFFGKLAQGRVSALIVDEDQHPSDTETVLIGRVVGRSGRTENTVMYLRKDYNLWHLTGFDYR